MTNDLFCLHYCQQDTIARPLAVHFFLYESFKIVLGISTKKSQILHFDMGSTYLLHFISFMLYLLFFSFPGVIPNLPIRNHFFIRSYLESVFIFITFLFVSYANLPLRIFFNEFSIF